MCTFCASPQTSALPFMSLPRWQRKVNEDAIVVQFVHWQDPWKRMGYPVRIEWGTSPATAVYPAGCSVKDFSAAAVLIPDTRLRIRRERKESGLRAEFSPDLLRMYKMWSAALSMGGGGVSCDEFCVVCGGVVDVAWHDGQSDEHDERECRASSGCVGCALCQLTLHASCGQALVNKLATLRVSPPAHPETTPRRVDVSREMWEQRGDSRNERRRDEEKEEAGFMDA